MSIILYSHIGQVITHRYLSPGVKKVHVIAKNRVKQLNREARIFIDYELQGTDCQFLNICTSSTSMLLIISSFSGSCMGISTCTHFVLENQIFKSSKAKMYQN